MRYAPQGKLWVGTFVALVFFLVFLGFLLPGRRSDSSYRDVQQKAQLHALGAATELFNNEFDGYPPLRRQ